MKKNNINHSADISNHNDSRSTSTDPEIKLG
jgi:hypothetical protein